MRTLFASLTFAVASGLALPPAVALDIQFQPAQGMLPEAVAAFGEAGRIWENAFTDDITIIIGIDYKQLAQGVLGETTSEKIFTTYEQMVGALERSIQSEADRTAFATLGPIPATRLLLNRTKDNPHGEGSGIPYLDENAGENNLKIWITRANAKALGLLDPHDVTADGFISFNTRFRFDFDPSDGIDPESFSFVAVAAHEIGHALGFVSGVDILDRHSLRCSTKGYFASDQFFYVTPEDLFRRSEESAGLGPDVADWTADRRVKYFAAGPADETIGGFSNGKCHADDQQASHWKDNLHLGLMDPTIAKGSHHDPTELDFVFFDTIGYEREPIVNAAAIETAEIDSELSDRIILTDEMLFVKTENDRATFSFSRDKDEPIIELRYEGGIIENPDPTPFVQVFGDGRVKIHYPSYTVNAGDYERQLNPEELQALLASFVSEDVAGERILDVDAFISADAPTLDIDPIGDHDVTVSVTLLADDIEGDMFIPAPGPDRIIRLPSNEILRSRILESDRQDLVQGVEQLENIAESMF